MTPTTLLKMAGALSTGVALLHVAILLVGAPAYRYFGAGERMARLADRGAPGPVVITLGLILIFAIWAAYAFSGAGLSPPLPFLREALIAIGLVYTLRGLVLAPQLIWFLSGHRDAVPGRYLLFSAASLFIGLIYLLGAAGRNRP